MISLDLDLLYLNRYFNIGVDKLQQYRNKSITEIMEIEAESGNKAAADFLTQITSDPTKLVKAFQLINPRNRYLILINMNKDDLTKFIGMLEPEQLVLGLSVFTQEGLLKLMLELPTETLSKLVMKNMDTEKFLQIIPEDFLDEFLTSDKIPPSVIKYVYDNNDKGCFFKTINEALDTNFSTLEEVLFNTKSSFVEGGIYSPATILFNSELFDKMLSFSEKNEQKPQKIGRNDPCPCGSGLKYKNCCLKKEL